MIRIFVVDTEEGKICVNVDNADDADRLLSEGARELSETEIEAHGMAGFENHVSPANTTVHDDGSITFTPPVIDPEEIIASYTLAIQKALDAFAKTRGYDGIMSACSYANSTDSVFAGEAACCISLRDETWRQAYAILDDVKSGKRPVPELANLIAELPVGSATWPTA